MRAQWIRKRGFSLTEVMVGMLLTAVMVTAVFTVALTAKRGVSRSDNRSAANNAGRLLLEELKNYQAADLTPGWGPNDGNWNLPGGACAAELIPASWGAIAYCDPASYALSAGCVHCATSRVPAALRADPVKMTLVYRVTNEYTGACAPAQACHMPRVDVQADWVETAP